MKQHEYYTVAIGNSTYMDRTPAPDETCGHRHRSTETAEKCQSKLIGMHRDGTGSMVCSAKWYNSYILGRENGKWIKV
jgi:hypothetical protein